MTDESKEIKECIPAWDSEYYERYKQDEDALILYEQTVNYLRPKQNEKILDVGYGNGIVVKKLIDAGADVFGIDYSTAGVIAAKKLCENSRIIKASTTHLPFRKEIFDKIFSLSTMEYLAENDLEMCLRDVKRVLKQDGVVLIHIPNPWGELVNRLYKKVFRKGSSSSKSKTLKSNKRVREKAVGGKSYSPVSLRRILRINGFNVEMWFGNRIPEKIPFRIRKRLIFLRGCGVFVQRDKR